MLEQSTVHNQECLIYTKKFPCSPSTSNKRYCVVLGIGGNETNTLSCFNKLMQIFAKNRFIDILSSSPLYYNPPFGFLQQQWFYNAIIRVMTSLSYKALFAYTSYLERKFGRPRKRLFKDAPRVLDIDIISFGNLCIHAPTLNIPHRAWKKRTSVIIPLLFEHYYANTI